jgi:hypothetical protein
MRLGSPRPIFKPREIRIPNNGYWYVEAEWSDGSMDEIGQFKTVSDAWDWIASQSRSWVSQRDREKSKP